jgi:hypothetical protein
MSQKLFENMHEIVQYFLNKFKKNSSPENFSFYFKSNPNVNVVEPQIPDLWLKTRIPFDKNQCFVRGELSNQLVDIGINLGNPNNYPKYLKNFIKIEYHL